MKPLNHERDLLLPSGDGDGTVSPTEDSSSTAPPSSASTSPWQFTRKAKVTNASNGMNRQRGPLNQSSNVLLVYRLGEMRSIANLNLVLALLCVVYCGINTTLLLVNYVNSHYDEDEFPVSAHVFHKLEFWGTFGFALVECISLISSPKPLLVIYDDTLLLKLIMCFNIIATLFAALLVTLNLEKFESLSHQVEYTNEVTMSFIDLLLLCSLLDKKRVGSKSNLLLSVIATLMAILQLSIYNWPGAPDERKEYEAHVCEFLFGMLSSGIAFWFCMDNKFVADREIGAILYGTHRDCPTCEAQQTEFQRVCVPAAPMHSKYQAV